MSTIVIMPGGFHPFHAGHADLYQQAKKAFPGADIYVAATNDQSERPFPFALKEKLAKLAGVESGHFVQVKSPFQAKEITQHYNPEQDVLIFVRSEKDRNEPPKPGGTKKDGSPAYFQPYTGKDLQPFSQHAYIDYLKTVEFGPGITSATQIRNAWPTLNDKRKTALVMSLYPAAQKNLKLAKNIVGMFDQVMGGQQGVAEGSKENNDVKLTYSQSTPNHLYIDATIDGSEAGGAAFKKIDGVWTGDMVYVQPYCRRQGVATKMYDYAEDLVGKITPSNNLKPKGKKFWANRIKPGVAEGYDDEDDEAPYHTRILDQKTKKVIADDGPYEFEDQAVDRAEAYRAWAKTKGMNIVAQVYQPAYGKNYVTWQVPEGNYDLKEQGVAEEQLDELSCWSGYHRVAGTKAGFPGSCAKNKTNEEDLAEQSNYDWSAEKEKIRSMSTTQRREYALARLEQTNDDKFAHIASKAGAGHSEIMNAINKGRQGVAEEQHSCPHCGGEIVSEELMNEKKDACYYKVKSRYKVWPSAYASGALVKCRKSGADSWGNGGKKNEGVAEGASIERKEGFRGRVTPDIEYIVRDEKGNIVRICKTKKEAKMWYDMVTLSKEEMWEKYPELKVNEGVAEEQLDEKWTKKYKDSINCSNPKGFSQKAHCAGKQKNESSILEGINRVDESLHDWFNKEKWVRMDTKGNIKGPCAKEPGEGKPKCLPQAKAHSLGKKGRASAAARKRREDPNPERSGKAINVNTKKQSNENIDKDWKKKLGAAALAGSMALGAAGANARVTPDGQGGFTGGMKPSATVVAPDNTPSATPPTASSDTSDPFKGLARAERADRQAQTITVGGKEYRMVEISPTDIRPRSGRQIVVPQAVLGERSIGNYMGILTGNTVFVISK